MKNQASPVSTEPRFETETLLIRSWNAARSTQAFAATSHGIFIIWIQWNKIHRISTPKIQVFEAEQNAFRSRDSARSTPTGYGLDGQGVGVRVPLGARFFSFPRRPDRF
jgi:hypothetical protein